MIHLFEAVFGVVALVMVGVALARRGLIAAEHQKALMNCNKGTVESLSTTSFLEEFIRLLCLRK